MKRRILFVDDEPALLEGLRRSLRSMRDEWDMEFVSSAADALTAMAQNPTDVVVTDMRMPGMSGADLLNEVMRLYPQTARFVLSGQTDEAMILRCLGSTHQYLSKPCSTDVLRTSIVRTAPLKDLFASEALSRLVGGIQKLPTVPELYSKVVRALQDPDTSLRDIGQIIEQDPAMTAQLLRLVNSAFFGTRRSMASASEAVLYLGVETTKTLVLSADLFSQFSDPQVAELSTALWKHSLGVARSAKAFSVHAGASGLNSDEAFAAGVLHDIGRLVLAANIPAYRDAVALASEKRIPLLEAEKVVLECTHADVGAYLLALWGLPFSVVEAVAFHHSPASSTFSHYSPLTGVHVAECFEKASSPTPENGNEQPDADYLLRVGCKSYLEAWRGLSESA